MDEIELDREGWMEGSWRWDPIRSRHASHAMVCLPVFVCAVLRSAARVARAQSQRRQSAHANAKRAQYAACTHCTRVRKSACIRRGRGSGARTYAAGSARAVCCCLYRKAKEIHMCAVLRSAARCSAQRTVRVMRKEARKSVRAPAHVR